MLILLQDPKGKDTIIINASEVRTLSESEWCLYSNNNPTTYDNIVCIVSTSGNKHFIYTETKTTQIMSWLYNAERCTIRGKLIGVKYGYDSENSAIS